MIDIRHLLKRYEDKIVLDDFSLKIGKGVIFGLLGPNGAGKTTLVSILNGLSNFQEGEITILGLPLRENIREIRRHTSLVPQKLAFYENLTVIENLHFFAGIQKVGGSKLDVVLEYAVHIGRLESMLNQKAHTLSGGQKRRLNLAIGLLNDPDILFFDEPTVGIDPESRNEILETVRSFKEENKTVIYTSHYMQEIEKICDEVAIIDKGKIVALGTLEEMLKEKNSSSVMIEIYETPLPKLQSIASDYDYLTVAGNTALVIREKNSIKLTEILRILEERGVEIRQIRYGATTLESLFIHLTSESVTDD